MKKGSLETRLNSLSGSEGATNPLVIASAFHRLMNAPSEAVVRKEFLQDDERTLPFGEFLSQLEYEMRPESETLPSIPILGKMQNMELCYLISAMQSEVFSNPLWVDFMSCNYPAFISLINGHNQFSAAISKSMYEFGQEVIKDHPISSYFKHSLELCRKPWNAYDEIGLYMRRVLNGYRFFYDTFFNPIFYAYKNGIAVTLPPDPDKLPEATRFSQKSI
jgi:hypothetical protein